MAVVLESVARLSILVFVVASMLAMRLQPTVGQILDPLSDRRLVATALAANFVVADSGVRDSPCHSALGGQRDCVVLLATAAGAPFLPKLVEMAEGNVAFGVGLMVLLMVATVAYVPAVLPVLLPGVQVNPLVIAGSLVVLMLVPLAIGLFVKARYADAAAALQPAASQTSSTALIFLVVLMLVLNFDILISVIGARVILALALLIAVPFGEGWILGGATRDTRSVLGLGTPNETFRQRSSSARRTSRIRTC